MGGGSCDKIPPKKYLADHHATHWPRGREGRVGYQAAGKREGPRRVRFATEIKSASEF